jgi:hypothetical protein
MDLPFSHKRVDATLDATLKSLRSPIATLRTTNTILSLLAFGVFVLACFAFRRDGPGSPFFAWSLLAAMASMFAGGALGLLFGLPTARKSDPGTAERNGGYEESTSLEQIADWLTKIIVGLTLTQFSSWSMAFDRLSVTLTHDLLCPASGGRCGSVPGAAIVLAYALGGFIVGYMWTRRFFMVEMVARDDSIRQMMRSQELREQAAKEGRVQSGSNTPQGASSNYEKVTEAILADGRKNAVGEARKVADSLKPGPDADDPWRGAFGGSNAVKDVILSATVTPVPGQTDNYRVDINVTGATPERQRDLSGHSLLFYLHPTFGDKVRLASFGSDGRALITLYAYGAFTIGALLDDGTVLELNLATLPGAPDGFRLS